MKGNSMNEVPLKHREYMVVAFMDDDDLDTTLNAYVRAGWAIEVIHFKWWSGGRIVFWRKRRSSCTN